MRNIDWEFKPTHRHLKTGGLYQVVAELYISEALKAYDFWTLDGIGQAVMITDDIRAGHQAVVYRNIRMEYYVRPWEMFHDGRFEKL